MKQEPFNPILAQYLKKYQEDPTSRVFAPLAEAYRKINRLDEAVRIAREGLKVHPGFIGGRVALARALFDQKYYQEVIDELTPVVQEVPDNLVAQRLVADSHLILGHIAEALASYKMLLYFAPQDPEASRMVYELESEAYETGALVLKNDPKPQPVPAFDVKPAQEALDDHLALQKVRWIRQIEFLQGLLQKVERYRARSAGIFSLGRG